MNSKLPKCAHEWVVSAELCDGSMAKSAFYTVYHRKKFKDSGQTVRNFDLVKITSVVDS